MALRRWAIMSMLATGLACADEPTPAQPRIHAQPANQTVSTAQPPAEPTPAPEECKVTIDDGGDLLGAVVSTKSWYVSARISRGHELSFDCPPIAERGDADIVGERSQREIVHWTNVDLGQRDQQGKLHARVKTADSNDGLPARWTEERKQQYREQNPHLDWSELDEASRDEPTTQQVPAKLEVVFKAGDLDWAQIEISGKTLRKPRSLELDPNQQTSLQPGSYELRVRREQGGTWLDAGSFEIDGKHQRHTVELEDSPRLRAVVVPQKRSTPPTN